MIMKKIILISIVLIIISCHFSNQLNFDENLTSKIITQYSIAKEPIELTKITNFEWDNYITITPYQIPDKVAEKYKINLSNISKYSSSDDTKFLLVFIKSNKAIKMCRLNADIKLSKNKILIIKK